MHKVFVYGTLKRGYGNHRLLEGSLFLGEALTKGEFTLYDGGFPYLKENGFSQIKGELYQVDDETFERLDHLEGYPSHYNRVETTVTLDKGGYEELHFPWVYVASERSKDYLINRPIIEGTIVEWNRK